MVFFVLTIACGFAMAQGLGLDVGVEFTLDDQINELTDEHDRGYVLTPTVEYTNSFGDLDLYIDFEYPIGFGYDDEEIHQTPYLEEEVGYNLYFGAASTLSLIVNNQNNFYLSPDVGDNANKIDGIVEPSVKFTQGFNFGDLYAQLGFPIDYLTEIKDGDMGLHSYLLLGFGHPSGFGAELTFNYDLSPDAEYAGTELLVTYEKDAIYAEVDVETNKDFDAFKITPEFDYSFNAFTFWANVEFDNVGGEGDIIISPTIGVKYSL
jgi:hypothetical protein